MALLAVLVLQSNRSTVLAKGATEYKAVPVEQSVNIETGQIVNSGDVRTTRFNKTQIVLDEYASQGWELATASYWVDPPSSNGMLKGTLIFRRKR